jgi:hypothetical protein
MVTIVPEMESKIIDDSHFDFHVTTKSKMINAINKMRNGADLLKSLSSLNFSTDKRWTKNTCNDPSVRALLEILEEYKRVEHRPSRAKILVPLIEYAIGLYASDLFFRERGAWFISQIIKRNQDFRVCFVPSFADPNNWYPLTRNSGVQGTEGNFYKIENDPDNQPNIDEEYKLWYGVDVNDDSFEVPLEERQRIIRDGQERIKNELARRGVKQ